VIEVLPNCVTLCNYSQNDCKVLSADGQSLELPTSRRDHTYQIILRADDQFLTVAGRWAVLWDDEHGSLHQESLHSMRPPPLPGQNDPNAADDNLEALVPSSTPSTPTFTKGPTSTAWTEGSPGAALHLTPEESAIHLKELLVKVRHSVEKALRARAELGSDSSPRQRQQKPQTEVITPSTSATPVVVAGEVIRSSPFECRPGAHASSAAQENAVEEPHHADTVSEAPEDMTTASSPVRPEQSADADEQTSPSALDSPSFPNEAVSPLIVTSPISAAQQQYLDQTYGHSDLKTGPPSGSDDLVRTGNKKRKLAGNSLPAQKVKRRTAPGEVPESSHAEHNIITVTPAPGQAKECPRSIQPTKSFGRAQSLSSQRPEERLLPQPKQTKIYFASNSMYRGDSRTSRILRDASVTVTDNVREADILCVGQGPLRRCGSTLLAIGGGKTIVRDAWIDEIRRVRYLPHPAPYLPSDPERESLWKFNLSQAIERGRYGLTHLLEGKIIHFTKRLLEAMTPDLVNDLSQVAKALGARQVKKLAPSRTTMRAEPVSGVSAATRIVLGNENDPDTSRLMALGLKLYSRHLLTCAVLRGRLDYAEFVLASPIKCEKEG
jgi:hypothetical protein